MAVDFRQSQRQAWLQQHYPSFELNPLAGDASFRRYFRVHSGDQRFVLMDAPPPQEDCRPFVRFAEQLHAGQVRVPRIIAADVEQGFLLLEDMGDELLLHALRRESPDTYYRLAIDELLRIQQAPLTPLPAFDADFVTMECRRFDEWFLQQHLGLSLSDADQRMLQSVYTLLADVSEAQPQTVIHRDYHSRNLMVLPNNRLGVIDFQDAMQGPVTYDLVSLLKDCYIDWPTEQVDVWAQYYLQQAQQCLTTIDWPSFKRWFDWQGIQRHIKAIGIFARLCHRDNKAGYINDIPRTLNYVIDTTQRYAEFQPFHQYLISTIAPKVAA